MRPGVWSSHRQWIRSTATITGQKFSVAYRLRALALMLARIVTRPRTWFKPRTVPILISLLGLMLILNALGSISIFVPSLVDVDICSNRVSGVQCSDGTRTCYIWNALVDAGKLSRTSRGAIQLQCDIMEGMEFPSAIMNMIRQPNQMCAEFDDQFTLIVMMGESDRGDLGANLALIEGAVRACQQSNIAQSNAQVVVGDNKFMGLWRNQFQVVPNDRQLCLKEATIIRERNIIPNLAFQQQLFLPLGNTTGRQSARIAMLMSDCSPSMPCSQLDAVLSQLKARSIPVEPIYIDDVTIRTVHDISDLAVLISARNRLDALAMFLPVTSTLIEIAFDDELRTISRYNAFVKYHRIRFVDPKPTAFEIAKIIRPQIPPVVVLPSQIAERRRRQPDPNNPRLAIVVPFRDSSDNTTQGLDRGANLSEFARYMNNFLTAAGRDFEIVVIEQEPGVLFNKAALFNIGYHLVQYDFTYMALHDVDQLPIDPRNDYHLPEKPTHLCSASSQYGWKPAYNTMVGGVLLLTTEHYQQINGMSNRFWGWGMEDDDLFFRLGATFGEVPKLDPRIGRYEALDHRRVQDLDNTPLFAYNKRYLDHVLANPSATQADGLNTVQYHVVRVMASEFGYTKYTVGLDLDWMPTALDQVPEVDLWTT